MQKSLLWQIDSHNFNMKQIEWKNFIQRRALGFSLIVLGAVVTFAPVFFGGWIIALLGIALVVAGLLQFVETFRSDDIDKSILSYGAGVVTTLLGGVLFLSPNLAVAGLRFAVTLFFIGDGAFKLFTAYKQTGQERWWGGFNGLFTIALGCFIWFFISAEFGILAIGVILGLRLIVEGWTMVFLPEKGFETPNFVPDRTPASGCKTVT